MSSKKRMSKKTENENEKTNSPQNTERCYGTLNFIPDSIHPKEDGIPSTIRITRIDTYFGRNAHNKNGLEQMRFVKAYISGTHTHLYLKEEAGKLIFMVADKSQNGTYVNDTVIMKGNEVQIEDGDTLTFFKPTPKLPGPCIQYLFQDNTQELPEMVYADALNQLRGLNSGTTTAFPPDIPTITREIMKTSKRPRVEPPTPPITNGISSNTPHKLTFNQPNENIKPSDCEELKAAVARLEKANLDLDKKANEKAERLQRTLHENKELVAELAQLKAEMIERMAVAENSWQRKLEQAESVAERWRLDLETERKKSSEKGRQAAQLASEAETVGRSRSELEKLVALLQDDKAKLEQKCADIGAKMINCTGENHNLQNQVRLEGQKSKTLSAQLVQVQSNEKAARDRAVALEAECQAASQKQLELEGQLEALHEELKLKQEQCLQIDDALVKAAALTLALESKTTEAARLTDQVLSAQAEAASCRTVIDTLREEVSRVSELNTLQATELESSRTVIAATNAELSHSRARVVEVEGLLRQQEAKIRQLRSDNTADLEGYARKHRRTEQALAISRSSLSKAEARIQKLGASLRKLQQTFNASFEILLHGVDHGGNVQEAGEEGLELLPTQVHADTQPQDMEDEDTDDLEVNTAAQDCWLTQEKGISGAELLRSAHGTMLQNGHSGCQTPVGGSDDEKMEGVEGSDSDDTQEEPGKRIFNFASQSLEEKSDPSGAEKSEEEQRNCEEEEEIEGTQEEISEELGMPALEETKHDTHPPTFAVTQRDEVSEENDKEVEAEESDSEPVKELESAHSKEPTSNDALADESLQRSQGEPARRSTRLNRAGTSNKKRSRGRGRRRNR